MDCEVLSEFHKDLVEFYSAGQGELEEVSSSLVCDGKGTGVETRLVMDCASPRLTDKFVFHFFLNEPCT